MTLLSAMNNVAMVRSPYIHAPENKLSLRLLTRLWACNNYSNMIDDEKNCQQPSSERYSYVGVKLHAHKAQPTMPMFKFSCCMLLNC